MVPVKEFTIIVLVTLINLLCASWHTPVACLLAHHHHRQRQQHLWGRGPPAWGSLACRHTQAQRRLFGQTSVTMNLSNLVEEYCTQLRRRCVKPSLRPSLSPIAGYSQHRLRRHPLKQHTCAQASLSRCCRQIHGSFACAKKTAEVMRLLITTQRHCDAASLIDDVRTVGTKLQAAKPAGRACKAQAQVA